MECNRLYGNMIAQSTKYCIKGVTTSATHTIIYACYFMSIVFVFMIFIFGSAI